MIALDIDGTIVDRSGIVSNRLKDATDKARIAGIRIVLATGRGFLASSSVTRALSLDGLIINYGGGLINDIETGSTVKANALEPGTVRTALQLGKEMDIHIHLYQKDTVVCAQSDPYLHRYINHLGLPYRIEPNITVTEWRNVPKVLAMVPVDKEEYYRTVFSQKLKGIAEVSGTEPGFIEINSFNASKGEALSFVADYYGIQRESVAAIGDSYLDMSMIEWAGSGIAMGNAVPAVKEIADMIIGPVDEDGVAHYIETLL